MISESGSVMASTNKKIIFITGASRSGTTLLSFILRKNAEVFGLRELHYFGDCWNPHGADEVVPDAQLVDAAAAVFVRQQQGVFTGRADQDADSLARTMAEELVVALIPEDRTYAGVFAAAVCQLSEAAGKAIPCEQTPRNIFYAEELLRHFPRAHVVHMMRDPRAVMASQKRRWQRRSLAADQKDIPFKQSLRVWVNYHPYTVAKLWTRASRRAQRLSEHERFTLVKFEDLLEEAETTVADLCERLDLDFDPAMLEVAQVNSSHQSSVGGAKPGLNKSAIDAWHDSLTLTEQAITEDKCSEMMQAFGYMPTATGGPMMLGKLRYGMSYVWHLAGVMVVNPRRAWIQARAVTSQTSGGSHR
jgi:hypothetical protein